MARRRRSWDDDDHDFYSSPPPRRRRGRLFFLAAIAVIGLLGWFGPSIVALTTLRDRPLQTLFAGIDGSIGSRKARWNWLGTIEYRDVILRDRQGRGVVGIDRLTLDRGLVGLAMNPSNVGTVRATGVEAILEVRRGGSNLEDLLAPWLAAPSTIAMPSLTVEVIDGGLQVIDLERRDGWRISGLVAAGPIGPQASVAGWTVSGRLMHASAATAAVDRPSRPAAVAGEAAIDEPSRDTRPIAAAATAALARDGGWSVSVPASTDPAAPATLAIATTRLPLGISSVVATRFDGLAVLDGLADLRMDLDVPPVGPTRPGEARKPWKMSGTLTGTKLAVCDAATLHEQIAIERLDAPFDLSVEGRLVTIRTLKASSPLFKAEASGRVWMPGDGSWDWLEHLIRSDFAFSAEIDLSAAARGLPGGLRVRPDVRVTAGQMQLAAAAYPDGGERVLEMRASARDLSAVQGERQLRWNEPFTAWLRGRRGLAAGERLRIEEARIASSAIELTASGGTEAGNVEWTVELDKLMKESAELLDMRSIELAGRSRGRLDVARQRSGNAYTASLSSSFEDVTVQLPGRPRLREPKFTVQVKGAGSLAGAAALVDECRMTIASEEDSLEATLAGGALVDYSAILQGSMTNRGGLVRPAPSSQGVAADISIVGDVGRWQDRLAILASTPSADEADLSGTLRATATLAAEGNAWQVTKFAAEVEKPGFRRLDRSIEEPRLLASGAGRFDPLTGRIDISSAEVLTSTVSLRTGGMAILPALRTDTAAGLPAMSSPLDRLRGRMQWQADLSRLEQWIATPLSAAAWPVAGRTWGTLEVLDTPTGLNVRIDATGDRLSLSSVPATSALGIGGGSAPSEVWAEPRARMVVEVTRAAGIDGMTIDKVSLDSSTASINATGTIGQLSTRGLVDLTGSVSYDWNALSRLLLPWTGGNVLLAGGGSRPFAIRGPLRQPAEIVFGPSATASQTTATEQPAERAIVLPDDWLKAARGLDASNDPRDSGRIALPASMPRPAAADASRWFREVSLDTSIAWQAAQVAGVPVDGGEMPLRLLDGQIAFGPFDIGAAGGRVRGAPWIRIVPGPAELVIPPGRILDRIDLSNKFCDRWVRWVAPLLGQSTVTSGMVSVDAGGARLPLADPFGGEFQGQVTFERFEVTPGSPAEPLINLIGKLQGLLDPRFAMNDKVVLMRVRPDPVRVMLTQRRLWHDGLVMDVGQVVVKTSGSVGADGTLAMTAEMAFRGDVVGQTPVVAALIRTPIMIPLKGTVNRPQFDAGAIDQIIARIVENTAQAVIGDGVSRGLEALFGNPQPPPR